MTLVETYACIPIRPPGRARIGGTILSATEALRRQSGWMSDLAERGTMCPLDRIEKPLHVNFDNKLQ